MFDRLPVTVLYVEDEEIIRKHAGRLMEQFVERVISASNGEEALGIFNTQKIDIVITDIKMPLISGLDMAKEIRKSNRLVPIIIVTAHSDLSKLLEAIEIGVNDFLIKPVNIEQLKQRIEKYSRELELAHKLKIQAERFQAMLDFQDNMLILTDGKKVFEANKSFVEFVGNDTAALLFENKASLDDLFIQDDGLISKLENRNWLSALIAGEFKNSIVRLKDSSNIEHVFYIKASRYSNDDEHYVVSFVNVTDYEEKRKTLEVLAHTDTLTAVANRLRFTAVLDSEIEKSKKVSSIFSLAMFDIDYFKKINDKFGHDVGDEVLVKICEIVKANIRPNDVLARWGVEEFMIIFINVNRDNAYMLCERLRNSISETSFSFKKQITCSFGITEYSNQEDKTVLLKRVDDALYEAKNSGRNCCKVK